MCVSNLLHKDKTIDIIEQNVNQNTLSKGKKSQVDLKQKGKKLWQSLIFSLKIRSYFTSLLGSLVYKQKCDKHLSIFSMYNVENQIQ